MNKPSPRVGQLALAALLGSAAALPSLSTQAFAAETSRLSDEPIPLLTPDQLPERTPPIFELGPDFLGTGNIPEGIELPTGAVWTPAFWVFGNLRTAVQFFDDGNGPSDQEAVARLQIFGNLHLTPTERVLIGFDPFRDGRAFTGCFLLEPNREAECELEWDPEPTVAFFEGDFGEIFPNLDPSDSSPLDVGFAFGRQPIFFQEGMMVNDTIDGLGITRDSIILPGVIDVRVTGFWGFNQVHRDNNTRDDNAFLYGLFTEADLRKSTVNLDFVYVDSDETDGVGGDQINIGAAAIQRIGKIGTAFRVNQSFALDREDAETSTGTLFFAEASYTPAYVDDVVYATAFFGLDQFASAARGELNGGPLGQVGLLFAAIGLGNYGAPLSNQADEAFGGAIGYQHFIDGSRTQAIIELGARGDTGDGNTAGVGVAGRFQHGLGARTVLQLDAFAAHTEQRDFNVGSRMELLVRF